MGHKEEHRPISCLSIIYGSRYQTGKIQLLNSYRCSCTPRAPTFTWSHTSLLQQTALLAPNDSLRAWQPLTQLSHYGEAGGEMNVAVSSQTGIYQPPDGWECHHPHLASWQSHFLHLQSPISSGRTSTFPVLTGCSLVRSVTQLRHAGARKWELLVSGELPAKHQLIRRNDISEAAHLDNLFIHIILTKTSQFYSS